jgi:hypothetical protein
MTKEKVFFLTKDQIESLDVKNDKTKSIKKKRVCIGIAKFYVKIAHIFAAIVMTINPIYVYKDNYGNLVKSTLFEKSKIPKNVPRKLYKLNICDNRINSLKRGLDKKENNEKEDKENVTIHPKICKMNINKQGTTKKLSEEPGIPELLQLYFDDNYDFSTGLFTGMSEETKKIFQKDLKNFYTIFTGKEEIPEDVKKFSDIKLREYHNRQGCQGPTGAFNISYTGSVKDKLFIDYANNLKEMITNANKKQNELLSVINVLFTYVIDPYTNKKKIRVNPKLTEELLQNAVVKSRNIIVELYLRCESDYVSGIKLYEAIVESQILDTTKKQIQTLEKPTDTSQTETQRMKDEVQSNVERAQNNLQLNHYSILHK